jgi:hypothetical protein
LVYSDKPSILSPALTHQQDMNVIIERSFMHIENLTDHVFSHCYDLLGPNDEIILEDYHSDVIQPGMTIKMMLWPLPEDVEPSNRSRSRAKEDDIISLSEILRGGRRSDSESSDSESSSSEESDEESDGYKRKNRKHRRIRIRSPSPSIISERPKPRRSTHKKHRRTRSRSRSPSTLRSRSRSRSRSRFDDNRVIDIDVLLDRGEYDFVSDDEVGGHHVPEFYTLEPPRPSSPDWFLNQEPRGKGKTKGKKSRDTGKKDKRASWRRSEKTRARKTVSECSE